MDQCKYRRSTRLLSSVYIVLMGICLIGLVTLVSFAIYYVSTHWPEISKSSDTEIALAEGTISFLWSHLTRIIVVSFILGIVGVNLFHATELRAEPMEAIHRVVIPHDKVLKTLINFAVYITLSGPPLYLVSQYCEELERVVIDTGQSHSCPWLNDADKEGEQSKKILEENAKTFDI